MAILASSLALLGALASTSSTADRVRLRLDDCVPEPDLVHDFVSIELGFDRVVEAEAEANTNVVVACGPEFRIHLDPNPLGVQDRTVAESDVRREGGARLLALNIVELVQEATLARPAPSGPPTASSAGITVSRPVAPSTSSSMRTHLAASPTVRLLSDPGRIAVGARASLDFDTAWTSTQAWSFRIDAGFEQSEAEVELGAIRARVVSASLQTGPRLRLASTVSIYWLVGIRGGWGWLDGRAQDTAQVQGTDGSGPWLGPMVAVRARFGRRFGVALGAEAGWTTYGVFGRDGGGNAVGLEKGWVGADLSLDWSFGGGG